MPQTFICDGMLGRLCKLLRMCGIDTRYSNQGMAVLLEARKENRVILTRNVRLRSKEGVFFVEHDTPVEQCCAVITTFNLENEMQPFSRCIECNALLKPVSKDAVRDKVPYYTFKHFDEYAQCPTCLRVYWKGSHYKRMMTDISNLVSAFKKKTV